MTDGKNDVPAIKELVAIEPLAVTFYDNQLRRSYLQDVPTSLAGGIVPNGTEFPAAPAVYQLFYRTDQGKMYFYDGANWLQLALLDSNSNLTIGGKYLKE